MADKIFNKLHGETRIKNSFNDLFSNDWEQLFAVSQLLEIIIQNLALCLKINGVEIVCIQPNSLLSTKENIIVKSSLFSFVFFILLVK